MKRMGIRWNNCSYALCLYYTGVCTIVSFVGLPESLHVVLGNHVAAALGSFDLSTQQTHDSGLNSILRTPVYSLCLEIGLIRSTLALAQPMVHHRLGTAPGTTDGGARSRLQDHT
jgi:hypothetical protein